MSLDRLRRDLGTVEAYAALVGILVGAGTYVVIKDVGMATGPSTILAFVVLSPVVLATSVPYAIFGGTSLGRLPGGEATHIAETFGKPWLAFVCAWLRIVSYIGALAFLAGGFADYALRCAGVEGATHSLRMVVAVGSLVAFFLLHAVGVKWFGRIQVLMCAFLGASILVFVAPGLLNVEGRLYEPFFTEGASGFLKGLPILFFAYAGFEALAQTAGEVVDSRRRLPRVFLRGIFLSTILFTLIATVVFGVLRLDELQGAEAPLETASAVFLPGWASWFVTFGGVLAVATSLNATMLVPSRLLVTLAAGGHIPRALGSVHPHTATPLVGLTVTLAGALALLLSGETQLALNIAVFALFILYGLHGVACWTLPTRRPDLWAEADPGVLRVLWRPAVLVSVAAMIALVVLQLIESLAVLVLLVYWLAAGIALWGVNRGLER